MVSPARKPMSSLRKGITRKFQIPCTREDGTPDKFKIYITANTDETGRLCEVFLKGDKMGGLASGALDAVATMISIGLQYGIPLEVLTCKLRNTRYSPSGWTGDPEFPSCSSPMDLVAQYLDRRFGKDKNDPTSGIVKP